MRVLLDTKRCIGSAQCMMAAEELFDIDDDEGVVKLIRQPTPNEAERARAAAIACPTGAIAVED